MEIGRRIQAAQILGGYGSVEELAEAINSSGLGTRTLRRIINPKDPRQPASHELVAIARACNIPESFFGGDFGFVDEQSEIETMHQDVASLSTQLNEHHDSLRETINDPTRNLAELRLHGRLNDLEARFDEMVANQRALLKAVAELQASFLRTTATAEQLAQEAEETQWPDDSAPEQRRTGTET